jgi:hypothetical protein
VGDGLRVFDSFSFTNTVVTFMIWAVVGVVCFGIVEAMGNAYYELRMEQQVSSSRLVHPASFSQFRFWRGVAFDTCTLAFGLAALAILCVLFALVVIPLALAASRVFLFDTAVAHVQYMLFGLLVLFVGLVLLNVNIRFLVARRRVLSIA